METGSKMHDIIVIDDNSCSEGEGGPTSKTNTGMDRAREFLADNIQHCLIAGASAINNGSHREDLDRQIAIQMQKEDDEQRKGDKKRKLIEKSDEEIARKLQQEEEKKIPYNIYPSSSSLTLMSIEDLQKELDRYGVASYEMTKKEELITALETAKAVGLKYIADKYEHENDHALACYIQEVEYHNDSLHYRKQLFTKEMVLASLECCQLDAVNYVNAQAKTMHEKALPDLEARVQMFEDFTKEGLIECLDYIQDDVPVIIHMKEDTLSLLVKDTHYRNQFETNTSGGTMNHSSRIKWENSMFGSCYDGVDGSLRVKYGCLNVSGDIEGVKSARKTYGPLFMVLQPHIRHRTTFFNQDTGHAFSTRNSSSSSATTTLATNEYYAHVLNRYSDSDLKAVINVCRSSRVGGARSHCTTYKEVQIHGPICLATDIQALSIPGRQKNASKELLEDVEAFRKKTNCNILWQEDLLNSED